VGRDLDRQGPSFRWGWQAEFAIPFKSLSFRPGQDVWGFNISRTIRRKIEEIAWASPRLDVKFQQVSEAGEIGGFLARRGRASAWISVFGSGKWLHRSQMTPRAGEAGGESLLNFTPNSALDNTINTDFAETEWTTGRSTYRFPSLPESGPFFLETRGVFDFGGTSSSSSSRDVVPFFSRPDRPGKRGGNTINPAAAHRPRGPIRHRRSGCLTRDSGESRRRISPVFRLQAQPLPPVLRRRTLTTRVRRCNHRRAPYELDASLSTFQTSWIRAQFQDRCLLSQERHEA